MRQLWALLLSLCCVNAFAAAPAGSWWNTSYGYRQQILIPAGSSALTSDYAVSVVFNHATHVTAGRSLATGNDVRVVQWNGSAWVELDRIIDPDTQWNTATTRLWFQTAASIAGGTTDDNYYIYFNNASAGTPPANAESIFLLYDDFSAASLSATRWTANNGVQIGGGQMRLNTNGGVRSNAAFPYDTIWETRARLTDTYGDFNYWGGATTVLFVNPILMFQADDNSHQAIARDIFITDTVPITPVNPTSLQNYTFTREGANVARFLINGNQVGTFVNSETPSSDLYVDLDNNESGEQIYYDWVRIRAYRNPDPTLSLAAAEPYVVPLPTPVGEWRFDQASWNGTSNEVVNSASNALHGAAITGANTQVAAPTPARTGDPGTCRYGAFDGTNDYVQIAHNSSLNLSSQLTISAWVYPRAWPTGGNLKTIISKDTNYEFHLNASGEVYWWWNTASLTSTASVPINQWSHIAVTWQSGAQRIYINGVLRGSSAVTGSLQTNTNNLQIGQDQSVAERYFNGYIDEVRLYSTALTQTQIDSIYGSTHACPVASTASHFVISHDGQGLNCAAETVTVSVRDNTNALFTGYTQSMTLNTSTNRGIWSLVTGNGSFSDGTSNDGIATYTWSGTQSSATFALSYPEGQSTFDVDAYQTSSTSFRDNDTEGLMTFAQSGFVVTSSAVADTLSPPFPTFTSPQTAGTSFNVHIAKYGSVGTSSTCRIVSDYAGTKTLKAWTSYQNPTVQRATVGLSATTTANVGAISNSSTLSVAFVAGRAVIGAKFKDVGQIALNFSDEYEATLAVPVTTTGSTNSFIVKPATFVLTNIRNGATANPAAANADGNVFVRAGQTFSVDIAARDSEGSNTPSFGLESPAESVRLTSTLIAPTGGSNPTLAEASGFTAFSNGQAAGGFAWSEVGIIRLTPDVRDGDYLGAGNVQGMTSGNVGRFIPNDFAVASNTPSFATGCAVAGADPGFTYAGQPFGYALAPVVTVTARAVNGATTTNYRDTFFKLTSGAALNRTYAPAASLDTSGLPAVGSDPQLVAGQGLGTLSFSSGSGLAYLRPSTPAAPFDATISLYVTVVDSDGVAYASNPYRVGGGDIGFTDGQQQRYGRLALRNQVGSELINLQGVLRSEYFSNAGFVVNTEDTCTTGVTVALSNYTGNLGAGESCVIGSAPTCSGATAQHFASTPVSGNFNLWFRAPGANNHGSAAVTATAPSWLQFNWDASTSALENPTGSIVFGIFQGVSPRRIYQREDIVR